MGLHVYVYKWNLQDCTNKGVTSHVNRLTVTNVDGPSEPTVDAPEALLLSGPHGTKHVVPLTGHETDGMVGPMMGGNYAASHDSRWSEAVGFYGAVAIHDRWETQEQYDQLSR